MQRKADIGILGGSGFYAFLEDIEEIDVDTPYGATSDKIAIGNFAGKTIAFLPRHGAKHQLPPHKVPYRANIHALSQLGVKKIIGPTASGSLQRHIRPGDFVVCDQFIDRTNGRADTFFDGPETIHPSSAYPYCSGLRRTALECGRKLGVTMHDGGTVVVIQGPRFSTAAESRWFRGMGWEVVNMTQYPECYLAKELRMCYCNIALITDYDAGLEGEDGIAPVTQEEVTRVFLENNEKLKGVLYEMIRDIDPDDMSCGCF